MAFSSPSCRTRIRKNGDGRFGSKRRAAAVLIELALVLPVFMMVVVGCIDFGRFAYYYVAVTNAAAAGALYGSLHPVTASTQSTWNSRIQTAATEEMQGVTGYNVQRLTVANPVWTVENGNGGLQRVRVQVTYRYDTLITWPGLSHQVNLTRTVEMRVIR